MAIDRNKQRAQERLAGILLIASALLALLFANTGLKPSYDTILHFKIGPPMPKFGVMDIDHWVSEALMALFFLLVGLEVKREWYDGRLSTPAERRLPIVAAAAGMLLPAAIYLLVTSGDPILTNGWAIPAATDIAFAVGVLAILGRHAPASIKLLLVTIAIVDDIGAVAIIALFYTAELDVWMLAGALSVILGMAAMTQFGVRRLWPYLISFALAWYLMLGSGVHATIAGVLAAFTIPLGRGEERSPLKRLEHAIHPWVMFIIVPIFGFASAGVALDAGLGALADPLPLAILLGLFLGKQFGIFGAIWLAIKSGLAPQPSCTSWRQLYGASIMCGIGFTMSLFISALAFPEAPLLVDEAKVGILAGSLLSALVGFAVLRFAPVIDDSNDDVSEADEIFGADQPDD